MERARVLRFLRIAVTALSLTACVLLIALWVRSYWALDFISRINNQGIMTTFGSNTGTIYFAHFDTGVIYKNSGISTTPRSWKFVSRKAQSNHSQFNWAHEQYRLSVRMPYWCVALVTVLTGVGIWLPCRFSLRTLLIAMTLVAVGMGTVIYLTG